MLYMATLHIQCIISFKNTPGLNGMSSEVKNNCLPLSIDAYKVKLELAMAKMNPAC